MNKKVDRFLRRIAAVSWEGLDSTGTYGKMDHIDSISLDAFRAWHYGKTLSDDEWRQVSRASNIRKGECWAAGVNKAFAEIDERNERTRRKTELFIRKYKALGEEKFKVWHGLQKRHHGCREDTENTTKRLLAKNDTNFNQDAPKNQKIPTI